MAPPRAANSDRADVGVSTLRGDSAASTTLPRSRTTEGFYFAFLSFGIINAIKLENCCRPAQLLKNERLFFCRLYVGECGRCLR